MSAFLAFALSPIGRLLITGAVALSLGAWQGWSLRARLDESAALRTTVHKLEREAQARDAAARTDQTQAEIDAGDRRALQEKIDALQSRPSPGECLSARDADGLRDLWGR